MQRLLPAILALMLVGAGAALAHPGHDHLIMGTIATIDGARVTMTTTDGVTVSFAMDAQTTYRRGAAAGTADDLTTGMRIIANVGDGIEPLVAKQIRYAAPRPQS